MAIKGIGSSASTGYINRLNSQLSDLHVQLSSGKKAQTYGMLGQGRDVALRMRSDIQNYKSYNDAIDRAQIHMGAVQNSLKAINSISQNARADFNGTAMGLNDGNFRQLKIGAEQRLNDALGLMNEKIAGRHLFSGAKVEQAPVETVSNIVNGVGAKAGLKQYISERKVADLGSANNGRLSIANTGTKVTLNEDGAHAFGLKLTNITQNITGLTTVSPGAAPANIDLEMTGAAPKADESLTFNFTLPDGKTIDVVIKAKTSGTSDKDGFVIGATPTDNATNLETSINAAVAFLAKGEMMAASAVKAADGFFGNPPKRVDPTPSLAGATALKNGTDADTLSWYKGDKTPGAERDSFKIYASKGSVLKVGVRADEQPIRDFVQNMALMVAESFDPSSKESNAHYAALKTRITAGLSDDNSKTSILELSSELGYKEKHLENLKTRNKSRVHMSENILTDTERADTYEVSAKLLSVKTQLEMSYKTTSLLSQTHLINYL